MNFLIVIAAFIIMEGFAWSAHKYVMHGFLWVLHKDHHDHSRRGRVERNDLFFVIFATPAIALMYAGAVRHFNFMFYIGLGIALYGVAYFFVHDILIHQRLKIFTNPDNGYLKAMKRAHKRHHKHVTKERGECFGFLWVPFKYRKMYSDKTKAV